MATSGKGSGVVGYNVQVAVDAKHHLIVAHEVTNSGSDRAQLGPMAKAARDAMGRTKLRAVASALSRPVKRARWQPAHSAAHYASRSVMSRGLFASELAENGHLAGLASTTERAKARALTGAFFLFDSRGYRLCYHLSRSSSLGSSP
jgi:hypothetical protein